mgnify:CR=1 FL=1
MKYKHNEYGDKEFEEYMDEKRMGDIKDAITEMTNEMISDDDINIFNQLIAEYIDLVIKELFNESFEANDIKLRVINYENEEEVE